MEWELPDFKRCFYCMPLRYGIIIFGYLNLAFSVLVIAVEVSMGFSDRLTSNTMSIYRGVNMYTQMWLPVLMYTFEIIFNVILLVGAHLKRPRLIRVYYYYGLMTSLAAFVCFLVIRDGFESLHYHVIEISFAFSGLVLQAYLLLLIRSELKKLRQKEGRCYINHMAEVVVEERT